MAFSENPEAWKKQARELQDEEDQDTQDQRPRTTTATRFFSRSNPLRRQKTGNNIDMTKSLNSQSTVVVKGGDRSGGLRTAILGGGDSGGAEMKKLPPHIARAKAFNTYGKERGRGKGKGEKSRGGNKHGSSGKSSKLTSKDAKPGDVKLIIAKDLPPEEGDSDDNLDDDDDDKKPPSAPPADQLKVGQAQSPSKSHGQPDIVTQIVGDRGKGGGGGASVGTGVPSVIHPKNPAPSARPDSSPTRTPPTGPPPTPAKPKCPWKKQWSEEHQVYYDYTEGGETSWEVPKGYWSY